MRQKVYNLRTSFRRSWITGLSIAFGAAFGVLFLIGKVFGGPVHKGLSCAVIAAAVAPVQAWLLRSFNISFAAWIIVTVAALGFIGSLFGVGTTEEMARRGLSVEWVGPLLGAVVGFAQWLLLRRRFPRAFRWIPVNLVGWIVGFLSAFLMMVAFGYTLFGHLVGGAVFGLVVGVATGFAIVFPANSEGEFRVYV
jgi:hypothetical protein